MSIRILFVLVLLGGLASLARAESNKLYQYTNGPSFVGKICQDILEAAHVKLGVGVRVETMPSERAIVQAFKEPYAGLVCRIGAFGNKYPTLVRVVPAILDLPASAFVKNTNLQIRGWKSLQDHKLAIQRGMVFAVENTMGMDRMLVTTNQQIIDLLKSGRVDVGVMNRFNGIKLISENGLGGSLVEVEPPLQVFKLYTYLKPESAHFGRSLGKAYEAMHRDSEIKSIVSNVLP